MKYIITLCLAIVFLLFIADTVHATTRGVVTGERVNVRAYAEVNGTNRLTQLTRGQVVEIVYEYGDFFRIIINENEYAYIASEFIRITETQGMVNNADVFLYDLPRQEGGEPMVRLFDGAVLTVVSSFEEWYGIYFFGDIVFVEKAAVDIPSFVIMQPRQLPGSITLACKIIELAMQYLGVPYRWAGNGPHSFDCSGFMVYILRPFGISVHRRSVDMARNGVQVTRNALEPGDLVFFSATPGGSRITHVGMYIGGGEFIHSATSTGVTIDRMDHSYYRPRFVTARRVLPQEV